jgi:Domain of unknown function (DUF4332)
VTRITDIDGIKGDYAARLRRIGIRSADELLRYGSNRRGRRQLAQVVGLDDRRVTEDDRRVTEWVNRADLLRVPGISTRYSNLLEAAGVTTVRQLRRRDPARLRDELLVVNQRRRRIVQRPPSLEEVTAWVAAARALPPVMRRW